MKTKAALVTNKKQLSKVKMKLLMQLAKAWLGPIHSKDVK
jgi:hypothetical protein